MAHGVGLGASVGQRCACFCVIFYKNQVQKKGDPPFQREKYKPASRACKSPKEHSAPKALNLY